MKLFDKKSKISKYNLVNKSNQLTPNYELSNKDVYFELYISPEKSVCIIGKLDNNYICWSSITKLNDKEANEEIFNYIANNAFNMYSGEFKVFGREKYDEIRKWYNCRINKSNIEGMCWSTPFGHYYGEDKDNHGKYFARDIQSFYNELIEKCDYRNNDELYINMLSSYLNILKKDTSGAYYYKMKPLISILQCESYLKLATNETVRNLYLECMKECSSLYNGYMNEVR